MHATRTKWLLPLFAAAAPALQREHEAVTLEQVPHHRHARGVVGKVALASA